MNVLEETTIHVGVSEWKVAKSPAKLRTTLGSCVGIVLYDKTKKIGGISHALLDEPPTGKIINRGKYARTAIEELIKDLEKLGTSKKNLTARIFGGASMFQNSVSNIFQNIGEKNVKVSREVLESHQIPIVFEDVGGHNGRTITLFLDDGRILLRSGTIEKYIYKV
ncbi:MAG: chemotaxis protein CheD [Leptospiraceae bacterium]|nr:chemotaxis protein CheD [Leptospiraceae bacterium]MDW7976667.1 chemotaxis protein CheD [Leptospiraceae bacterium]